MQAISYFTKREGAGWKVMMCFCLVVHDIYKYLNIYIFFGN